MKSINAKNFNNNLLAKILSNIKYASNLTKNFHGQYPVSLNFIKGKYFGKTALQSLLNQTNCVGARMYYGLKADQTQCLVFVGVDSNGNDLVNGEIMENGILSPTNCSNSNSLNS